MSTPLNTLPPLGLALLEPKVASRQKLYSSVRFSRESRAQLAGSDFVFGDIFFPWNLSSFSTNTKLTVVVWGMTLETWLLFLVSGCLMSPHAAKGL